MGNLEVGFVDDFIAQEHEVEVERTGGAWVRTFAAVLSLDRHQFLEERTAIQRRHAGDGGVEKQRLILEPLPFRVGFDDVRK
jgi:hypothetical protein